MYYYPNKYNDPVYFSHLVYYLKYKLEDNIDEGFYYNKSNTQVFNDLRFLVSFLVDDLKDFSLYCWSHENELVFSESEDFFKYIEDNDINIFDDLTMNCQLGLVKIKLKINIPKIIPNHIHDIFEQHLFCTLPQFSETLESGDG